MKTAANSKHTLLLMGEMLKELNPVAYHACINIHTPLLEDWSLIPVVFNKVAQLHESNTTTHPIFLAVLYKLFAPWKLHKINPKLTAGLRDELNAVLGYQNSEMINYFSSNIIVLYKGRRWSAMIDSLATEILENLSKPVIADPVANLTQPYLMEENQIVVRLPRKLKKQKLKSIWS